MANRIARAASLCLFLLWSFNSSATANDCGRVVADEDFIQINPLALADLKRINLGRNEIFKAIHEISIPETNGCWSGATGNFDGQLISLGVAQWNLGQGSLQPLLLAFRARFPTSDAFQQELKAKMPEYGTLIYSSGCLRPKTTAECREKILRLQTTSGALIPRFRNELNALFESNVMIQIQVDHFVGLLGRVRSDLERIFPQTTPSPKQVKWAIDTKVQQDSFPGNEAIERVRASISKLGPPQRIPAVESLIVWYEGLCRSADQGGVNRDCEWNVGRWQPLLGDLSAEQIDLLYLSHVRSRTANGQAGFYQALTFQRRAKIIFGTGSVAGRRD